MFIDVYSAVAALLAILIIALKILRDIDFSFAIFILPGFIMVLVAYIQ
jgi:hypothetical protein